MKQGELSLKGHLTATLRLAWPVIIGQLGQMAIGISDTAMIGQLGKEALGAAALSNGILWLILVLGIGIGVAMAPLAAQTQAEGDEKQNERLLQQGVWVALFSGVILTLLILICVFLLPYMGQDVQVTALTKPYLTLLGFSSLPITLFFVLKHYIEGFSVMKPGMYITFLIVAINIFLNWVFIFGNLGLPQMGLEGAAYATIFSRLIGVGLLFFYLSSSQKFRKYRWYKFYHRVDRGTIRKILEIGIPSGMQYFFEVGAFSFAVIMAGWLGKVQQSAHQIAIQIAAVSYMFYLGIANAAAIRIGSALGSKRHELIAKASRAAIITGLGFTIVFAAILVLFRFKIPSPFIREGETEVVLMAAQLILIASFFQAGDGLQAICMGALKGFSDVRVPTIISFVAYWVIGIPAAYIFSHVLNMDIAGVWLGLMVGLSVSALLLLIRLARKGREYRLPIVHYPLAESEINPDL